MHEVFSHLQNNYQCYEGARAGEMGELDDICYGKRGFRAIKLTEGSPFGKCHF